MKKETYDSIGVIIFNLIKREEERMMLKYPTFRFRTDFRFELAIRIKELWEKENGIK